MATTERTFTPPWRIVIAAAVAVLLVIGAYTLIYERHSAETTAPPVATAGVTRALATGPLVAFVVQRERKPVPDFAFQDESGKDLKISDWKGRIVLLNLWATWCGPCRKEMPELAALQQKLGSDDFEVLAISLDRAGAVTARPFMAEIKAEALKLYLDPSSKILAELKAPGLPTTLLIDRQGREIGRLVGPAPWASPEAVRLIEAALKEP
jgi:thiol-disulfide isomerase/thioredoxin